MALVVVVLGWLVGVLVVVGEVAAELGALELVEALSRRARGGGGRLGRRGC